MVRLSTGLRNILMQQNGKSFADALENGFIRIFTGNQPVGGANAAETGIPLLDITKDGGVITAGQAENCLNPILAGDGTLGKPTNEHWFGFALADGVAGWFRYYDNAGITGESTSAIRFDGSVGTNDDMTVSNTSMVAGEIVQLVSLTVLMPEQ